MFKRKIDDYVMATDRAAQYPRIKFTDWREIGVIQKFFSCGTVSIQLVEPLPAGQYLLFGKRKQVIKLTQRFDKVYYENFH